jgi:hypothetical protein
MKQIIKGFVHFEKEPWMDQPKFSIYSCDMSSCGYVLVGEQEFEVDGLPDASALLRMQIGQLEERKRTLRLKLAEELAAIDARISDLTCLEHSPAPEVFADEGQPF